MIRQFGNPLGSVANGQATIQTFTKVTPRAVKTSEKCMNFSPSVAKDHPRMKRSYRMIGVTGHLVNGKRHIVVIVKGPNYGQRFAGQPHSE